MTVSRRVWWLVLLSATIALGTGGRLEAQTPNDPASAAEKNIVRSRKLNEQFDGGRKWAVVIGVNEFLDPSISKLKYCVSDAKLIAKQLVEKCGYDAKRVLLITDDQEKAHLRPLRINLDNQIRNWLSHAEKGDTVLVFFSGHGFLDDKGQGFLVPQDGQQNKLGLTAFRTSDLKDMLQQCDASQKLLVLDCCHAGGEKDSANPGPSSQELSTAFEKAEGLITLASCQKKEKSLEWEKKQQGLFTYFLAEGLSGAADYDKNGLVDSDELYRFAVDEVPTTAQVELNGKQTPVRIIGEDVVGVFALARTANRPVTTPPLPPTPPKLLVAPFTREAAKAAQQGWAKSLGREVEESNSIGMKLTLIPAGEFLMGSTAADVENLVRDFSDFKKEYADDEQPQHRVQITVPFYLGTLEVTKGQFAKFVADDGYKTDAERDEKGGWGYNADAKKSEQDSRYSWRSAGWTPYGDDHPVVNVSWNDAKAFCAWLSRQEGKTYRLPTEAEWEYACRAGTSTRHPGGNDKSSLVTIGNVADATYAAKFTAPFALAEKDGWVFTAPVGTFKANAFGVHDMIGNVYEWCGDTYDEKLYAQRTGTTTDSLQTSGSEYRVLRGGSWDGYPGFARSAGRGGITPDDRDRVNGFRVVSASGARTR